MSRKCFALDKSNGLELAEDPHRAKFAASSVADGCLLISLYLKDGEGMSPYNRALLEGLAAELARTDKQWIIGADANMSPQALAESGWVDMVGGHIIAPDLPTCTSDTFDFFIVSSELRKAVHGVQVITNASSFPHSPVRLLLRAGIPRRHCRALRKPPIIQGRVPFGPMDEATHNLFQQNGLTTDNDSDSSGGSSSSSSGGSSSSCTRRLPARPYWPGAPATVHFTLASRAKRHGEVDPEKGPKKYNEQASRTDS